MIGDLNGNKDFSVIKPFAFWTQHVLPLIYGDEISYMETMGKMRNILNELIKNNNNLPEYIQQMIEEYISSGAIEEVIDKILSNFILNVKYPPMGVPKAKGDGTTNEHDSIQGCIDYAAANGGGIVYLPAGKYLTSPLVLKSGVTLLGFGRYAVSLVLDGGATTHLITGTVTDAGILNVTLDAKMSSQVNRVDAIELIGNHIDIKGCLVRDCYTSINIQKDGSAVNICDVICEIASDACLRIGGTDGGLLVDGLEMTGLSTNLGAAYIVTDSNDDIYRNINIHGTGAIGIDVSGSGNYFDGNISGVTKDYDDSIGDNTFNLFGKTRVENLTGEVVVNANALSQTVENTYTINAKDVVLNPTNPLTYKTPINYNDRYSYVVAKDHNNTQYNILVAGENFNPNQDASLTLNGTPTPEKFNIKTAYNDNSNIGTSIGEYFYKTNVPEKDLNTLTIATYNVLSTDYWRWPAVPPTDTDTGLAHAVDVIIRSGAKIIGMNEISNSPKFTPIKKLSTIRFSNVYYEGDASPGLQGTKLGNAIMSDNNFPLLDKNVTVMPDNLDNRILLNVKINVNGKTLSIYCTQLSLNESIRNTQLTTVLNNMSEDGSSYKILMGDLNFTPSEPEFARITGAGYVSTNTDKPTYPSDSPATIIDYIFRTPNITVNNYNTIADELASDHCLLFANITLN